MGSPSVRGPVAAVVGAVAVCCVFEVAVALGVLGAIAGFSLGGWAMLVLGLCAVLGLAGLGRARWANRERTADEAPRQGVNE